MENPLIPVNEDINEIEINLYMGNLETACNSELLQKFKIKRILSILQATFPDKYKIEGIEYKYVNIWDIEYEDIISYFPDCSEFIEGGLIKGEGVFVHCRAGRSRSAAIIMAFMMKKYGYTMEYTIKAITVLRNEVSPNVGFRNQLKLWQKMGFVLLGSDPEYRLVLVNAVKCRILIIKKFGQNENTNTLLEALNSAFISYLQKVMNAEINCKSLNRGTNYMCKNCSTHLFDQINLIQRPGTTQSCHSLYIEPQKWILEEIVTNFKSLKEAIDGEIKCFQCKELLGTFDWHKTGYKCDCEAHNGLQQYLVIKIDSNKLSQ